MILVNDKHISIFSKYLRFSQIQDPSHDVCFITSEGGKIFAHKFVLLSSLPQISTLLCDQCIKGHEDVIILLPNINIFDLRTALSEVYSTNLSTFLQDILGYNHKSSSSSAITDQAQKKPEADFLNYEDYEAKFSDYEAILSSNKFDINDKSFEKETLLDKFEIKSVSSDADEFEDVSERPLDMDPAYVEIEDEYIDNLVPESNSIHSSTTTTDAVNPCETLEEAIQVLPDHTFVRKTIIGKKGKMKGVRRIVFSLIIGPHTFKRIRTNNDITYFYCVDCQRMKKVVSAIATFSPGDFPEEDTYVLQQAPSLDDHCCQQSGTETVIKLARAKMRQRVQENPNKSLPKIYNEVRKETFNAVDKHQKLAIARDFPSFRCIQSELYKEKKVMNMNQESQSTENLDLGRGKTMGVEELSMKVNVVSNDDDLEEANVPLNYHSKETSESVSGIYDKDLKDVIGDDVTERPLDFDLSYVDITEENVQTTIPEANTICSSSATTDTINHQKTLEEANGVLPDHTFVRKTIIGKSGKMAGVRRIAFTLIIGPHTFKRHRITEKQTYFSCVDCLRKNRTMTAIATFSPGDFPEEDTYVLQQAPSPDEHFCQLSGTEAIINVARMKIRQRVQENPNKSVTKIYNEVRKETFDAVDKKQKLAMARDFPSFKSIQATYFVERKATNQELQSTRDSNLGKSLVSDVEETSMKVNLVSKDHDLEESSVFLKNHSDETSKSVSEIYDEVLQEVIGEDDDSKLLSKLNKFPSLKMIETELYREHKHLLKRKTKDPKEASDIFDSESIPKTGQFTNDSDKVKEIILNRYDILRGVQTSKKSMDIEVTKGIFRNIDHQVIFNNGHRIDIIGTTNEKVHAYVDFQYSYRYKTSFPINCINFKCNGFIEKDKVKIDCSARLSFHTSLSETSGKSNFTLKSLSENHKHPTCSIDDILQRMGKDHFCKYLSRNVGRINEIESLVGEEKEKEVMNFYKKFLTYFLPYIPTEYHSRYKKSLDNYNRNMQIYSRFKKRL